MRFKYLFIPVLILMLSCKGPKKSIDLETMSAIYLEGSYSKTLTKAVDDCLSLLNKVAPFEISKENYGRINCTKELHPFIAEKLPANYASKSSMSFAILKHKNRLWIYSTSDEGVKNGLYYLLEKLDYRFYFPGDLWTIIPDTLDFESIQDEIVIPDFTNIEFFGGGGLPSHKILDPSNQRKKTWDLWKSRMRFGHTFTTTGHIGEAFNKRNKDVINQHPEYRALINGERVPWNLTGKQCISNPDARKLFVNDRLAEYAKWSDRFTTEELLKRYLSVEPADGINHCTCESCMAMGTISDRVFIRANEVAKALEKIEPEAKLCILAYNQHAAIPQVPIHKNIYVSIVPYAFQQVAVPEKFINDWASTAPEVGIRDYIGTPPWQYDLPGLDFLNNLPDKMRYWKAQNILDIKMESSYSIGATAIPLYMYNRLAWNLETDPSAELKELCEDLFAEVAKPMLQMFTRWSTNYKLPYSLDLDWKDIEEAERNAKKEITKKRVAAFRNYIVYIEKFNLLLEKKESNTITDEDVEDLLSYMWSIHDSNFVHSTFMNHWILRQMVKDKKHLTDKWSVKAKNIKENTWATLISKKSRILNNHSRSTPSDDGLIQSIPAQELNLQLNSIPRKNDLKISFNADHNFKFYKDKSQQIRFQLIAKKSKVIVPNSIISLFDEDDVLIESINLQRNDISNTIDWSHIPEGNYRINFRVRRCIVELYLTDSSPTLFTHKLQCMHCPDNIDFIPSHEQEQIIAQIGKKKQTDDIDNVYGTISRNKLTQSNGLTLNFKPVVHSSFETINGNGYFKF